MIGSTMNNQVIDNQKTALKYGHDVKKELVHGPFPASKGRPDQVRKDFDQQEYWTS
jgi:hypothetical protein